jgi:hypothetical protein
MIFWPVRQDRRAPSRPLNFTLRLGQWRGVIRPQQRLDALAQLGISATFAVQKGGALGRVGPLTVAVANTAWKGEGASAPRVCPRLEPKLL